MQVLSRGSQAALALTLGPKGKSGPLFWPERNYAMRSVCSRLLKRRNQDVGKRWGTISGLPVPDDLGKESPEDWTLLGDKAQSSG